MNSRNKIKKQGNSPASIADFAYNFVSDLNHHYNRYLKKGWSASKIYKYRRKQSANRKKNKRTA